MKENFISGDVNIRKVKLTELVEPIQDRPGGDWLVCKVYKTHIVNWPPIECSKCFALQCVKCHNRLREKDKCPACHDQEFRPSVTVNLNAKRMLD